MAVNTWDSPTNEDPEICGLDSVTQAFRESINGGLNQASLDTMEILITGELSPIHLFVL